MSLAKKLATVPQTVPQFFPFKIPSLGVTMDHGDFSTTFRFIEKHHDRIFDSVHSDHFFQEPMTDKKEAFLRDRTDHFLFQKDGAVMGVVMGNPIDWCSYYVRYCAFEEQFQKLGIVQHSFPVLIDYISSMGFQQIEIDVSPSNHPQIQVMNRTGFVITGQFNSEKWGSLLRFTKYIDTQRQKTFLRIFTQGKGDL